MDAELLQDPPKPKRAPADESRRQLMALPLSVVHRAVHGAGVGFEVLMLIRACCVSAMACDQAIAPQGLIAFIDDNLPQLDPATATPVLEPSPQETAS